ncbi:MAG TPA: hypothetical protein VGE86_08255 [Thermoanaerobaculia bacterium]
MKHLKVGVSLVLLCALALPLGAMRVRRLSLDETRDKAASVVVGEVIGKSTRLAASGETVWTDYEFRVDETLAGATVRGTRIIPIAGGEALGISVSHPGVPHLEVGGRYLLFLNDGNRFPAPTIGIGQGMYRIQDVIADGTQKTLLLSADGEPLEMFGGRIGRGRQAVVENGIFIGAPANELERQAQRVEIEAFDAQGNPIPSEKFVAKAPAPRGAFATLDDVRRFLNKEIASVGSPR